MKIISLILLSIYIIFFLVSKQQKLSKISFSYPNLVMFFFFSVIYTFFFKLFFFTFSNFFLKVFLFLSFWVYFSYIFRFIFLGLYFFFRKFFVSLIYSHYLFFNKISGKIKKLFPYLFLVHLIFFGCLFFFKFSYLILFGFFISYVFPNPNLFSIRLDNAINGYQFDCELLKINSTASGIVTLTRYQSNLLFQRQENISFLRRKDFLFCNDMYNYI